MLHLIEAATGWSHWLAGLVIVPLQSVKSEKSGPVCASLILTVYCSVVLCSFFFHIVILSRKIHPGFCTQSFLFWIQFCVWYFLFNFVVFSLSITFALVRLCFHFDLVFIVFFVSYPQVFPILLCSPCLVCVSVMFCVCPVSSLVCVLWFMCFSLSLSVSFLFYFDNRLSCVLCSVLLPLLLVNWICSLAPVPQLMCAFKSSISLCSLSRRSLIPSSWVSRLFGVCLPSV